MEKKDILMDTILKSAMTEFLHNGYDKASMRVIASKANVTTGALYARFSNKDKLFATLVEPVASDFINICNRNNLNNEIKICSSHRIGNINIETSQEIVDLIYENADIFSLLINGSNGSSYENFIEKIIEIEEREVLNLLNKFKKQGYPTMEVSELEIHVLVSGQCHTLFEVVRHNITKEEASIQVRNIINFYSCGWRKIYGFPDEE